MRNSIIIPTYINSEGLRKCVDSIVASTEMADLEVWIVCNGSPKETVEWANSLGNPFRVLSCQDALGYTKAVNLGMMAASGDNLILLNDDVEILDWGRDDVWINMLTYPLSDESIAVTGSTKDFWAKEKPFIVFFCAAMRKKVAQALGYLDEAFNPGAGEDADFCLKAQRKGYRVVQVPEEVPYWETKFPIWHVGHATCRRIEGWTEVTERNTKILEERYPRTEEDRQFQRNFSDGKQNCHKWGTV